MITLVLSTVYEQRERPAARVGSCCARAVRTPPCIVTQTPTIVGYHPPTIVAVIVAEL